MPSSAAQRNIPPEIVYRRSEGPVPIEDGAALLVDKPISITSHDVVEAVRDATDVQKVGHAGTLDPLATGLLIILVARPATRLQEAFMHLSKEYEGSMRLGESTPSHDTETEVEERSDISFLSREQIETTCESYVGAFWQTPPMYSAVQIEGERLYEKARRGETVDRPPRRVRLDAFDVLGWNAPDLQFRVECSKGTYVRALARDLGQDLGVGAHLTELRRIAIGPYSVDAAWSLDDLQWVLSDDDSEQS